jgi:hypothetical protein
MHTILLITVSFFQILPNKKTPMSNIGADCRHISLGGIGGPRPSDWKSEISDMRGDFGRNFDEIPTLPEQTTAQWRSRCAVK